VIVVDTCVLIDVSMFRQPTRVGLNWSVLQLAPIYGWFTEGLEMHGLKEARALLDELD